MINENIEHLRNEMSIVVLFNRNQVLFQVCNAIFHRHHRTVLHNIKLIVLNVMMMIKVMIVKM